MRVAILAAFLSAAVAVSLPSGHPASVVVRDAFVQTSLRHSETLPIPDPDLSAISATISGRPDTVVNCGGNDWWTWGEVPLRPDGTTEAVVFLEPFLCRQLRRFKGGWRPNAACYRKPSHCTTAYAALSALVLTHESIHVEGDTNEASTECKAVQRVRRTFRLLGETANPLYVEALVRYALWWHEIDIAYVDIHTGERPYYAPECKPDGELDASPGDGVWP